MKTREQIYGKEAAALLRDITTYHCMKRSQIIKLYPGKERQVENLLSHLTRQGRIFYDTGSDAYFDSREMQTDAEMLAALWVLADFGDRTEYHSSDEFPIKIIFFAEGETYEVICLPPDKETLIEHALSHRADEDSGKRILIVEDAEQISHIHIPNAVFCTADSDTGNVQYYRKEQKEQEELIE